MATKNQKIPQSVRFSAEAEEQINELSKIFSETPVKILHRAVELLYKNRVQAIEDEAKERLERAKGESEN